MEARRTLKVFIASPSDAKRFRDASSHCVVAVNGQLDRSNGPEFQLVGWEEVSGTASRPQEAIDALVDQCDYMICVFDKSWGTAPGGSTGYTSGTEEELFTALLGLGQDDHPMRDIWVAFTDSQGQAGEVAALQKQIRDRNALYYEVVDSLATFEARLTTRLLGWGKDSVKEPRNVELRTSSGRDVLKADQLRRQGELLVNLGQAEIGISTLETAAAIGGPSEEIALARVLARVGKLDEAGIRVDAALKTLLLTDRDLRAPSVAEALQFRAYVWRRENKPFEAQQRLLQARDLLHGTDPYTVRVRCRVLDELGLSHLSLDELEDALKCFEESRELRKASSDELGVAQSNVNLARLYVAMGDLDTAFVEASHALLALKDTTPSSLHANTYALHAQLSKRQGDHEAALNYAKKCLSLNQQLGNRRGEAIAHNLLSQIYARLGNDLLAGHHARESLELNRQNRETQEPPVVAELAKRGGSGLPPIGGPGKLGNS